MMSFGISSATADSLTSVNELIVSWIQAQQRNENLVQFARLLVDELSLVRNKWRECEEQKRSNENLIVRREQETQELQRKICKITAELKDSRCEVRKLMDENQDLKDESEDIRKVLSRVTLLVKPHLDNAESDLFKKLAFLNESALTRVKSRRGRNVSVEEVEYDTTSDNIAYDNTENSLDDDPEDDVPLRSGHVYRRGSRSKTKDCDRHRAHSVQPLKSQNAKRNRSKIQQDIIVEEQDPRPCKRSRSGREIVVTPEITGEPEGKAPTSSKITIRRSMNRSMSESNLLTEGKTEIHKRTPKLNVKTLSTLDMRDNFRTPTKGSWLQGHPLERRPHKFQRMPSTFTFTCCDVCNKRIGSFISGKPALKCRDCKQVAHSGCSVRMALPCVPRDVPCRTPKTPNQKKYKMYKLQDYCPTTSPMIPYPIIHFVVELERRQLVQEGLYRVPGNKAEVNKVLHYMMESRAIPNLENVDVEVLAGSVKQFLLDLRDPLIPMSSSSEFIRAARTSKTDLLDLAIRDLPQPNRDTLAFLILHWMRVIEKCSINKMTRENMARCVALGVMGFMAKGDTCLTGANREVGERERVLIELLSMPKNYWEIFLDQNGTNPAIVQQLKSPSLDVSLGPFTAGGNFTPNISRPRNQRYFPDLK